MEDDLGWDRAGISLGVSIGLLLFGLAGPGTGWLIDRYGPRRITLGGIVLIALSTAIGASVQTLWQFALVWGALSNGLIGTHFIAHSLDHGISEATAAGTLALMGGMNFVGTLTSGWLTDRYDPRKLLAVYYSLRGLSLFLLPAVTSFEGLAIFAVVFGLDYIATVPPTAALTADIFGRRNVGAVFGWVFFAHQLGAALAAYAGGLTRDLLGDYTAAFLAVGLLAILGGLMALRIDRDVRSVPVPDPLPTPA